MTTKGQQKSPAHYRWALLCLLIFNLKLWSQQTPLITAAKPPLNTEEVVHNLQEKNRERAEALHQFQGTRTYRMQYRGFPSNRDAEMVVTMSFQAPDRKEFKVVSQTGSKFVIDKVFKRLLESEQEAMNEKNRRQTALSSENYDFTLADYEVTSEGARYVLNTIPKIKNKFLYRGKVWVDAEDFAVVKIEAEPAKNPSFWITKTQIYHTYVKVGDFWLPAKNQTQSSIRLGGKALLSIEYTNYLIGDASPLHGSERAHKSTNPESLSRLLLLSLDSPQIP